AEALTDFEGALIVVAHDRHLLAAATDQWMLVADGKVTPFDGGLDDYKEWAKAYRARTGPRAMESVASESRLDRRAWRRAGGAGAPAPCERAQALRETPRRDRDGAHRARKRALAGRRMARFGGSLRGSESRPVAGDAQAPVGVRRTHCAARGGLAVDAGRDGT